MKTIDLKYRFPFRKSWWMFILMTTSGFLAYAVSEDWSKLPLMIFPLAYVVIHETRYQLTKENGTLSLRVDYVFFKKKIKSFTNDFINELFIEQCNDRYYGIFVRLKDGERILLDTKATLDEAQKIQKEVKAIYSS